MKILHLVDIPWWSGLSAYALECVEAHQASGHQVWIAAQKNSLPYKRADQLHFQVLPIAGRGFWDSLYNFYAIGKIIWKVRPDWLIAHTGSTHWIAYLWGKCMHVPIIRTRATAQKVKQNKINLKLYSGCKWIVTASKNLENECLERLTIALKDKIVTIYPTAPDPFTRPLSNDKQMAEKPRIGMLARLDPVKGHSYFLKSAKIVQESFPEVEFHLAGSEENLSWQDLCEEITALNLKNVYYHGFLTSEEVPNFMDSCTIGVIASIGSEEVSRALLEWMSAGKPVIATSVGCIPEILKDGEGGWLVPPENFEKMALKVKELLAQPELLKKMGEMNQAKCLNQFSQARFQLEWEKLLNG